MKKNLLIFLLFICCKGLGQSQTALVIGIDEYKPPVGTNASNARADWPNLDGCKNDAQSIKALIVQYFAFKEQNVKELYDRAATREAILKAMNEMIDNCSAGDIAFIYYAGHGSQVKNSLSLEKDLKDESIVPADSWKEGVADIRDKELAKIYNRFVDKKIKLTLVFDCCHSGSIARGLYQPKYRYIAASEMDAKDNSNPPSPERRSKSNFLVLSAAQDNEYAQEQIDENNLPHGAFTLALIKALNQQSSRAPVQNIFNSIKAILKGNGKSQEPVLAGDTSRFNETLFGLDKALIPDKNLVPVIKVTGNKVTVQGGFAAGINIDNELSRVNDKDSVRIRITAVTGINQSEAELVYGNAGTIMPGQLFEVTNWVSSAAPLINIFIPTGDYSYSDLRRFSSINSKIKKQYPSGWMNSFEHALPDVTLNISDNKFTVLEFAKGKNGVSPLSDFSVNGIDRFIKGKKLFVNLPASAILKEALLARFKPYKMMRIVDDPSQAQYILFGTSAANETIEYGLLRSDVAADDTLSSLPVCTKTTALKDSSAGSYKEVADVIFEHALKLSKIRGWINLVSPRESDFFPYHLLMQNRNSNKVVSGVKVGDPLTLKIEADNDYLEKPVSPKYIYVFVIDSKGQMQLLYPSVSDGNQENKFPFKKDGVLVKSYTINDGIEAAHPVGTDSFFLLASAEQIPGFAQLFTQDGVRGLNNSNNNNSLLSLLDMGNEASARGLKNSTPTNWTLKKLFIVTKR